MPLYSKIQKWDIFYAHLDPVQGSEIAKTRPVLVVSPNEINKFLNTVIILPITNTGKNYPTRIVLPAGNLATGQIILDQIRTIDKSRLAQKLGVLPLSIQATVTFFLQELFS